MLMGYTSVVKLIILIKNGPRGQNKCFRKPPSLERCQGFHGVPKQSREPIRTQTSGSGGCRDFETSLWSRHFRQRQDVEDRFLWYVLESPSIIPWPLILVGTEHCSEPNVRNMFGTCSRIIMDYRYLDIWMHGHGRYGDFENSSFRKREV